MCFFCVVTPIFCVTYKINKWYQKDCITFQAPSIRWKMKRVFLTSIKSKFDSCFHWNCTIVVFHELSIELVFLGHVSQPDFISKHPLFSKSIMEIVCVTGRPRKPTFTSHQKQKSCYLTLLNDMNQDIFCSRQYHLNRLTSIDKSIAFLLRLILGNSKCF